jgi:hypothetical protein
VDCAKSKSVVRSTTRRSPAASRCRIGRRVESASEWNNCTAGHALARGALAAGAPACRWPDNEPVGVALVLGGLLVLAGVYVGALRPHSAAVNAKTDTGPSTAASCGAQLSITVASNFHAKALFLALEIVPAQLDSLTMS